MLNFYIPHREAEEKIVLLLRRHPFILIVRFAFWIVVAVMPVLLYIMLGHIFGPMLRQELIVPIVTAFLSIYYLYVWLFVFNTFIDYYLDVWIVTNHRIINIEQNGLFSRTTSEQRLYRIQDVTAETNGFFQTIFNFGTVHIQTAAEEERFIFKQIPDPDGCAQKINALAEENKKSHHEEGKIEGENKSPTV